MACTAFKIKKNCVLPDQFAHNQFLPLHTRLSQNGLLLWGGGKTNRVVSSSSPSN